MIDLLIDNRKRWLYWLLLSRWPAHPVSYGLHAHAWLTRLSVDIRLGKKIG